jgi:arylsulfatase A
MHRRRFMKALTSLSLASMANIQCSHEKQPNILFIMVDDFGYECLSCNGSTSYRTLNLDRLASQGMRFTQCHSALHTHPGTVDDRQIQFSKLYRVWQFKAG